jgi:hypothetical protein
MCIAAIDTKKRTADAEQITSGSLKKTFFPMCSHMYCTSVFLKKLVNRLLTITDVMSKIKELMKAHII